MARNMKKNISFLSLILILLFLIPQSGCDVAQQAQKASNLVRCDFRIRSVEKLSIAGVSFQNVKSVNDLNIGDLARIMAGLTSPTVPLSLQLNLEGRNPNSTPAGLNRLEWILFIDDIQMTGGILENPFTIPASGTANIPVQIGMDLKQVLKGKSADAILNFCMNLAGVGNVPTRFKVKLKPTIYLAGVPLTYPGYIVVKTSYGSN